MPATKNAPLYQQIYDEIKDAIEKGVYAPKERIPSELELAEQYEVSRITVRRAVEELCSDGYLVKQQGRGTFVSTPHINRQFHASTLQTFTALCADNGMKAGAHVVDRQIVPARQNEMEFFGLQKGALLLHIKRVRTADGEPIFEENVFVPFDAYRELLTADLEDKSIFAEVGRVGGTPIVSAGYRTVEAVRASAEQAADWASLRTIRCSTCAPALSVPMASRSCSANSTTWAVATSWSCRVGSAVLTNGGPVDAANAPKRQSAE